MIRIHLWFIVNASVLGLMFVNKNLFMTPIWTIFVFSSLILETKEEIKKRYSTPLPLSALIGAFCVIGLLLLGAVTGINFRMNQWVAEHEIVLQNISNMLIGGVLLVAYLRLILHKLKEKQQQRIPSNVNSEKKMESKHSRT